MDEARRFLRYVMPGLVYFVETLLLLFIVFPGWTQCLVLDSIGEKSLGLALGTVLTSGTLGYIFSSVHHCCHWYLCSDEEILDHSPVINRLISEELIPAEPHTTQVNRKAAFEISLALWYRSELGKHIGDPAYKKLDSLGDQAHGLGTSRIASFFAVATALAFCFKIGTISPHVEPLIRFLSMLLLGGSITYLFHDGYSRVGKMAQAIYDRILHYALERARPRQML